MELTTLVAIAAVCAIAAIWLAKRGTVAPPLPSFSAQGPAIIAAQPQQSQQPQNAGAVIAVRPQLSQDAATEAAAAAVAAATAQADKTAQVVQAAKTNVEAAQKQYDSAVQTYGQGNAPAPVGNALQNAQAALQQQQANQAAAEAALQKASAAAAAAAAVTLEEQQEAARQAAAAAAAAAEAAQQQAAATLWNQLLQQSEARSAAEMAAYIAANPNCTTCPPGFAPDPNAVSVCYPTQPYGPYTGVAATTAQAVSAPQGGPRPYYTGNWTLSTVRNVWNASGSEVLNPNGGNPINGQYWSNPCPQIPPSCQQCPDWWTPVPGQPGMCQPPVPYWGGALQPAYCSTTNYAKLSAEQKNALRGPCSITWASPCPAAQ